MNGQHLKGETRATWAHPMKAAYTRYGPPDVVEVNHIEKPVPKDSEVLIRVRAASVDPLDSRTMYGGRYFVRILLGQRKPKIKPLGVDVENSKQSLQEAGFQSLGNGGQGWNRTAASLIRLAKRCTLNDLTGLRWLRKVLKGRYRQQNLGLNSWARKHSLLTATGHSIKSTGPFGSPSPFFWTACQSSC